MDSQNTGFAIALADEGGSFVLPAAYTGGRVKDNAVVLAFGGDAEGEHKNLTVEGLVLKNGLKVPASLVGASAGRTSGGTSGGSTSGGTSGGTFSTEGRTTVDVELTLDFKDVVLWEKGALLGELLLGLSRPALTSAMGFGRAAGEASPVQYALDPPVLYAETGEGEYLTFFAEGASVFSVRAGAVAEGGVVAKRSGQVLPFVSGGEEITDTAGSAVFFSVVRYSGDSPAPAQPFPYAVGETDRVFSNFDGSAVAIATPSAVRYAVMGKNGRFCAKKAFSSAFAVPSANVAFDGEYLYVAGEGSLYKYDAQSGALYDKVACPDASALFVSGRDILLLGTASADVYTETNGGLTRRISLEGPFDAASFDAPDMILTVAKGANVYQYNVTDSGFIPMFGSKTHNLPFVPEGLVGRFGYIAAVAGGALCTYNFTDGRTSFVDTGGQVYLDANGFYAAAYSGGETKILDISYTIKSANMPEMQGKVFPLPSGLLSDQGTFYPFTRRGKRFELASEFLDDEYVIYTKTPYFSQKTLKLTLEAEV